jgi:hypothetical protein
MTTPETPTETPSNNQLFYRSLIAGLLRPEVRFSDAHYLSVALPPEDDFPGATGWLSDYPTYLLTAAAELSEQRQQKFVAALEAGRTDVAMPSLTQEDRHRFLEQGLAYVDMEFLIGPQKEKRGYVVGRPQDLQPDDYLLAGAVNTGLQPTEDPFVYDTTRRLHVPDPFAEPHLLALYKYLQAPQQPTP